LILLVLKFKTTAKGAKEDAKKKSFDFLRVFLRAFAVCIVH
jgi:hypothetical protein